MRTLRFHQGFTLRRDRLAAMIRCIAEGKGGSTETLSLFMGVNKPVVEGFRGWLAKTGIGQASAKGSTLTAFGQLVAEHDPQLRDVNTLWLLHYFLVSEHDERAEVWYRCFNEFLSPGRRFRLDELRRYVESQIGETPANRDGIDKDAGTLVSCYTDPENLGGLQLLTKPTRDSVVVGPCSAPNPLIAGFVLFDSWQRRFGETDSVRLSALVEEPESIGRVFVADYAAVRSIIGQLERLGLVAFADTQYEPVTRRFFDEPLMLVRRYYQQP